MVARGRVAVCDPAAAAAGVQPGQRLSTALGFAPGLQVCERSGEREAAALEQLACWAGHFTPQVSLAPPATLLLEIGGCLRLFGGAETLVAQAMAGAGEQGYAVTWATAPTPLGATWLAWHGLAQAISDGATLHAALAGLPCELPAWPAEVRARLQSFGLRTLGDMRSLPGAGARRRLGEAALTELAQAWDEIPDLRPAFPFPERFALALELPARVEHAEALDFAAQRLLAALAGWLRTRQLAVRTCRLLLTHDDGPPTVLPLQLSEATADGDRLLRLLREHLARLALPAPVEAITLKADEIEPLAPASRDLFDRPPQGEGAPACLERLRARLGEAAVHGIAAAPDYRPEAASRPDPPAANPQAPALPPGPRPLWLLPAPQAIAEQGGRPTWGGPLQLLTRAERIESGWWDSGEPGATGDLRRDYFIARNAQGRTLWIFRDGDGWFLHGHFA